MAALVVGRGLQVVATIATIKVATSLLSPSQVGSINQITALSVLLYAMFVMPVSYYVGRGLLDWHDAGLLSRRFRNYIRYVVLVSLFCALAVFLFERVGDVISSVSARWVALLVGVYLAAFPLHTAVSNGLVVLGRKVAYAVFINAAVWIGLAVAVFLFWETNKPEMWLLGLYGGFIVSSCLYLASAYFRFPDSRPAGPVQDHVPFTYKKVFAFAWPMVIIYALHWVQLQSYRFTLEDVAGLASVGLFVAAHAVCAAPMQTFQTMFNDFYSQTLYGKLKGGTREQQARAWNGYAEAYIPSVILFGSFLAGCGPYLAKVFLGPQFQVVAPMLIWPALIETARAISTSVDTMGIVKIDMRVNLAPAIVGAICSPPLIYALASEDPLAGTGIALSLAGLAGLLVVVPLSYRVLPIHWPIERIILALIAGLPMVIAGNVASRSTGALGWSETWIALAAGALYLVTLQYLFARKWLHKVPA